MTRLALLSDQHGNLPPIPDCDLLVIAGDLCGGPDYVCGRWRPDLSDERWWDWLKNEFAAWISQAPCAIVVAGNHDTTIEKYDFPRLDRVSYLRGSGCETHGLRFWGCPWIKRFDHLAFNRNESDLSMHYNRVPPGVDVIISHGPPFGRGDRLGEQCLGSVELLDTIARVNPKLVVCGHIHEARGEYDYFGTKIINTACDWTVIDL